MPRICNDCRHYKPERPLADDVRFFSHAYCDNPEIDKIHDRSSDKKFKRLLVNGRKGNHKNY